MKRDKRLWVCNFSSVNKNSRILRMFLLTFTFLCLGHFISGCSLFGPADKPDFSKMKWNDLDITYWVLEKTGGPRIKRTFSCEDKDILSLLHRSLSIKDIGPNSVANGDSFVVTLDDGEVWDCRFVFEDRFDMCCRSKKYFSYILTLSNNDFFNKVTDLCLINEKKITPGAIKENIILRTNMNNESYQVLPPK